MDPKMKRRLTVALIFVASNLYQILYGGGVDTAHLDPRSSTTFKDISITSSRLQYIRPPGHKEELFSMFEELTNSSSPRWQQLPKTCKEIAQKYGIPETSRDLTCNSNGATTPIGWIPSKPKSDNMGNSATAHNDNGTGPAWSHTGRIPRLIFQSWKTNNVKEDVCNNLLVWSKMNPEYDYFLFDDEAVDNFIRLEYGKETFAAYACVAVGAAKCDVWRLLILYLFGGVYFDADVKLVTPFEEWNWGNRSVVTARSCTNAPRKHPGGCAHQWGMIYTPQHPVLYSAIRQTLGNLAERKATHVYDVSFWSYYHAWRNGPYNQSYMPEWGEAMGGRVLFFDEAAKESMVKDNGHWQKAKKIWHDRCLPDPIV